MPYRPRPSVSAFPAGDIPYNVVVEFGYRGSRSLAGRISLKDAVDVALHSPFRDVHMASNLAIRHAVFAYKDHHLPLSRGQMDVIQGWPPVLLVSRSTFSPRGCGRS